MSESYEWKRAGPNVYFQSNLCWITYEVSFNELDVMAADRNLKMYSRNGLCFYMWT